MVAPGACLILCQRHTRFCCFVSISPPPPKHWVHQGAPSIDILCIHETHPSILTECIMMHCLMHPVFTQHTDQVHNEALHTLPCIETLVDRVQQKLCFPSFYLLVKTDVTAPSNPDPPEGGTQSRGFFMLVTSTSTTDCNCNFFDADCKFSCCVIVKGFSF